ncbi:surface antigen-like protein [Mucilaginibacter frigoritolerans]|uniref:Surface antigen-like protein n=1 Tax=Mucilaginibacter frigoritolerans TaxID=652788 RepID=A0A562TWR9_9SPHI|nr:surface antigen-like protein [Mucilaginibacter frigoritolerans]
MLIIAAGVLIKLSHRSMLNFYKLKFFISLILIIPALHFNGLAQGVKPADSVTVAIEPDYNKVSKLHRALLGENYRLLWATKVKLPVFYLEKEKGGLKILQLGGGMQTKSLRLQDSSGQEWVLRTIQKYPEKVLPPNLRPTIAKDIVQDQISAEHPFAALTVPELAEALSIPHAHPKIVYVPDDPALGSYRKDFANQVFLFEEREPLNADKTDNTPKAQRKLQDDDANRVDQHLVLRARLLDMLLGDWDRHEDQWRWERTKDSDGIVYKPVPRDRDQVYDSANGFLPWAVSNYLLMAKFQSYGYHIRSISRWNLNARYFDRYFLNGLSEQDWKTEIAYVQKTLTDEVITRAIKQMPDTIFKLSGNDIIKKLIARRSVLNEQGLTYYMFLAKTVEIPASDKREKFEIVNQPDGSLSVTINRVKKDGRVERTVYQRTFSPSVTNEIRLYGFGGKDQFVVSGKKASPIVVRMIGGDDEDTFTIDSTLHNKSRLYVYDRSDEKNNLPPSSQARLRTAADTSVNSYNKFSFKYDYLQPLLLTSYNKDYGFQLIPQFVYEKHGFRKEPYSSRQSLTVDYGFGNNSLLLNYKGEFKKAIGDDDLVANVLSKGPNYNSYFFGVGNNSVFVNSGSKDIEYYRNVYDYIAADLRIRHKYGKWVGSLGIMEEYYNGERDDNKNKYLNEYNQLHPDQNVFSTQFSTGVIGSLTLDTRTKGVIPHNGIYWNTIASGMTSVNVSNHTFGKFLTEFSFYLNPDRDSVFVISNRIGGGIIAGNANYYQQVKLGGDLDLRGFYIWRFTGKSMAYDNFEIHLKLFDFTSYITPGSVGVIGFNDVGRVWTPGESSTALHDGYGGGFYIIPAQLVLIQAVVGFSKEGTYPYITIGYKF